MTQALQESRDLQESYGVACIIPRRKAAAILGISIRTLDYIEERDKTFPNRVAVSAKGFGYRADALTKWIDARTSARTSAHRKSGFCKEQVAA